MKRHFVPETGAAGCVRWSESLHLHARALVPPGHEGGRPVLLGHSVVGRLEDDQGEEVDEVNLEVKVEELDLEVENEVQAFRVMYLRSLCS